VVEAGDLDLAGSVRLLSVLAAVSESGVRVVVCDLSKLAVPQQIPLLTVFPTAQRRSGPWPRTALHLAAPEPELAVRLRKTGMGRFVSMHTTMDAAIEAAMADAPSSRHELAMVPDPANPRLARQALIRMWPDSLGEGDRHHDGLVIVSELTTNADRHVRRPFTTTLTLSPRRFLTAVTDRSRAEPILRPVEPRAIGGRGLRTWTACSSPRARIGIWARRSTPRVGSACSTCASGREAHTTKSSW
jgi:hypothetical protein